MRASSILNNGFEEKRKKMCGKNKLVLSCMCEEKLKRLEKDCQHTTTTIQNGLSHSSSTSLSLSPLNHLHYTLCPVLRGVIPFAFHKTDFYSTTGPTTTTIPFDAFVQFHASFYIFFFYQQWILFSLHFCLVWCDCRGKRQRPKERS